MSLAVADSVAGAVAKLQALLGPAGCLDSPDAMARYLVDWRGLYRGAGTRGRADPPRPRKSPRACGLCRERRIAIVPQGGNTGLVGGQTPADDGEQSCCRCGGLNGPRRRRRSQHHDRAKPACIAADRPGSGRRGRPAVPAVARRARAAAPIGGNLSTNAGGIAVLRYGMARDLVLGLEVVLADGRVWNGLRTLQQGQHRLRPASNLFIGAEGTLGIITAATLKLFPRPRAVETAFVAAARRRPRRWSCCRASRRTRRRHAHQLRADRRTSRRFRRAPRARHPRSARGKAPLVRADRSCRRRATAACAPRWSRSWREGARGRLVDRRRARREPRRSARPSGRCARTWSAAQKQEGGSIKHDISVPVGRGAGFHRPRPSPPVGGAVPGARPVPFGHARRRQHPLQPAAAASAATQAASWRAGDAINARRARHRACDMGGSISAEHGIGRLQARRARALQGAGRARTDAGAQAHARSQEPAESRAKVDLMSYTPPIEQMRFALEAAGRSRRAARALPGGEAIEPDMLAQILERGRQARRATCWRRSTRSATATARGSRTAWCARRRASQEAYRAFVEGGWNALPFDPALWRPGPALGCSPPPSRRCGSRPTWPSRSARC